ncbi:MAG: glycosyltransferase family 2 protein [Phycisphaerales bacterium]|jgi:glycosyltransferase involved in cell wall biosynthesis
MSDPAPALSDGPAATPRSNIEVLMIVRDEEANLPHSLASVAAWVDRVHVVDSGSTDRTVEIARSYGANVVHQSWLGYARQKNHALETIDFAADWILILDADESVEPDLREELLAIAARPVDEVSERGFWINRYFVFLGRRIRHCGYYPSWNLRLFRRGFARYEEREVHEHMLVDGPVGRLRGHLEHHDRRGLEAYMAKHNRYSTLEARELVSIRRGDSDAAASSVGGPLALRRWFKNRIYPRLPARWLFRFLFMYVLRLGVLDGLAGLRFCLFISAYELLIGLKMVELLQKEPDRS